MIFLGFSFLILLFFLPSHTVLVYGLLATAPVLLSNNSYCSSSSCRFSKERVMEVRDGGEGGWWSIYRVGGGVARGKGAEAVWKVIW